MSNSGFRTGVKDKLRFVPVHRLVLKLGQELCDLAPAFHGLTGCDTTSGFHQIGKKKAWKALRSNVQTHTGIASLGEVTPPSPETLSAAEKFVCSMYTTSTKAGTTADDVRYKYKLIFTQHVG